MLLLRHPNEKLGNSQLYPHELVTPDLSLSFHQQQTRLHQMIEKLFPLETIYLTLL